MSFKTKMQQASFYFGTAGLVFLSPGNIVALYALVNNTSRIFTFQRGIDFAVGQKLRSLRLATFYTRLLTHPLCGDTTRLLFKDDTNFSNNIMSASIKIIETLYIPSPVVHV